MDDIKQRIEDANGKALGILLGAEPRWTGIKRAIDAVPGMGPNFILHAGPPIRFADMVPVQRKGIVGGALHAGLAKSADEAIGMIGAGEIQLRSANDLFCVGAGAGIVTPNMVVNVCVDAKTGQEGYCIPFEGRNGLGAWGNYDAEIEKNLSEIENFFAPAVDEVLAKNGGIELKSIIAKGMQMGDECHTRQIACSLNLIGAIVPMLFGSDLPSRTVTRVTEMFLSTERWFHPLGMAGSMASVRGIKGLEYSTIVTTIVQNGVQTGLKIAGTGERWYLADAPRMEGEFFSSKWGPEAAVPYMGDSTVTEVMGMGAFAAAAAPNVLRLRGGGWREAIAQSEEMKKICVGVNHNYPIPLLDFTGPGLGIDFRKVLDTGITPICHGGIISREGGQIGAGAARFPLKVYIEALRGFLDTYGIS
jgi:hypothetical protein